MPIESRAEDRALLTAAIQAGHPVPWFGTLADLVAFADRAGVPAAGLSVHGTLIPAPAREDDHG